MSKQISLLEYFTGNNFDKNAGLIKLTLWYFTNVFFVRNIFNPVSGIKIFLLRLFGARIGKGVVIKPGVNIKFPWKIAIGDYCWIGENVWIDNLDTVVIGNNVCISQGSMLLTGNHDYTKSTFDYRNGPIILEDGVWIGAKAIVCPGLICKSHAILTVGSIATKSLEAYSIYQGNPAKKIKERVINHNP